MSMYIKRGLFTLVELLVVVAIILILIAILVPALGKAKSMAYRAVCSGNQRQIILGTASYASDCDDYIPLGPAGTGSKNYIYYNATNNPYCFSEFAINYLNVKMKPTAQNMGYPVNPENVLRCPAATLPDHIYYYIHNAIFRRSRVSYSFWAYISPASPPDSVNLGVRLSKMATPTITSGFPRQKKIMLGDDLSDLVEECYYIDPANEGKTYSNVNHDGHGGNWTLPDGSVQWFPRSKLAKPAGKYNYYPMEHATLYNIFWAGNEYYLAYYWNGSSFTPKWSDKGEWK